MKMDNNTSQLVTCLRYHAHKASTDEVVRELLQDAADTIERLLEQAQAVEQIAEEHGAPADERAGEMLGGGTRGEGQSDHAMGTSPTASFIRETASPAQ